MMTPNLESDDLAANGSVEAEEPTTNLDLLLALSGSGKRLWADEHADEYVARLRRDWD